MSGWPNWLYWVWSVVVRVALLPIVVPFRAYEWLTNTSPSRTAMKQSVIKNGPHNTVYTWEVDASKPKCWVEGSEYKFNSTLVDVKNVAL